MTPFYDAAGVTIYNGNAIDVLRQMPDGSVNCCITSPPYWGLRDYGLPPSIWGGDQDCVHAWVEELVKTEVGRGNWAQAINGRGEVQGALAEFREPIRATAVRGSCSICGAWRGCFGLEPTPQMYVDHTICLFREVYRVLRDDGTLWLNLGDSYANDAKWGGSTGGKHATGLHNEPIGRGKRNTGLKPKDLVGIPWRVAFALQADGWYLRSDIIWAKPAPMPESVADRPTRSHEYIFLMAKSERYYYDYEAIKEPSKNSWMEPNHSGRRMVENVAKARSAGADHDNPFGDTRNKRDVWTVNSDPFPEAHFATFPPALILPCVLAGCPDGGLILDPFTGAGTTALVAKENGRRFIGSELNAEYCQIATRRLRQDVLRF